MSTLVVFGSDGWLGKSLIEQIKKEYFKNYKLNNIILHSYKKQYFENLQNNSDYNFIPFCGDFKNESTFISLKKLIDLFKKEEIYVIVVSGIIHPAKYRYFDLINFYSIKKIFNIFRNYKLKKFTYISSNSPFGFNCNEKPFDEKSKYNPIGGYGISKMNTEKFLLNKQHRDVITILRAPWFHGKNMPKRQKKFLISASKGLFPLINSGKNIRSIVNVEDLAKASILVTFEKRKHQIYWICEPNKSMFQILKIIKFGAKCLGNKANLKNNLYLPIGFSSFFYIIDTILQKMRFYNMYIHVFSEIGQDIFADNSLYMKEFGLKHTFSPLEDSIVDELKEIN